MPGGVDVFLFGSAGRDAPTPSDVDVLVVHDGNAGAALADFVARVRGATVAGVPVEVIVLTTVEERELDFVRAQRAVKVTHNHS